MSRKAVRGLFLLVLILGASAAFADLVTSGPAVPTGSWTQQFLESGVGPFNNVLFTITTPGVTWGDPGNPTGMNSFIPADGSDWGSTNSNNQQTVWAFDNWYGVGYPTSLYFNATFSSDQSVPFDAVFYAWNDNTLVDNANVNWDGHNWNISPVASSVPEPASLVLLGSAIVPFAIRRFKR
jgi:hypothetical protein